MSQETGVQSQVESAKMVLDVSLLSTHYYKLQIKDKWSNPKGRISTFPYISA